MKKLNKIARVARKTAKVITVIGVNVVAAQNPVIAAAIVANTYGKNHKN